MVKDYFPRLIDSFTVTDISSLIIVGGILVVVVVIVVVLASFIRISACFSTFSFQAVMLYQPGLLTHARTHLPLCALIRLSVLASNRRWPPPPPPPATGRFLPLFLFPSGCYRPDALTACLPCRTQFSHSSLQKE